MPVVYGNEPETVLRASPKASAKKKNSVLMGTWLETSTTSPDGEWLFATPRSNRGKPGWVQKAHIRDTPCLKVFYVDVGQGDGAIIESPQGTILIDGGPSSKYAKFLRHRYGPIIDAGQKVHIDAVVVSHPDMDHFRGLTTLLKDPDFTFGTVYHNGIIRYDDELVSGFDLGPLSADEETLKKTFSTLAQAGALIDEGKLMHTFNEFWLAVWNASAEGRLEGAQVLTVRDGYLPGFQSHGPDRLAAQVLGPVPTSMSGAIRYSTFEDPHDHGGSFSPSSSHTRNGHSIVLKLTYGDHSFLFGGDLNIPAERHLIAHYAGSNPFQVDVAKACHHGSSDFTTDFLKLVNPHASVFSSGDHKTFDHPMPDAMGAMARHSRGDIPLLFSTELGRAQSKTKVHYGLVNARSNGETLVMAQMKEAHKKADVWDSFTVPYKGRFPGV